MEACWPEGGGATLRTWRSLTLSAQPLGELISLSGRNAVVTGGARGLGRAIARRLAEAGASVLIGDLDHAGASATADELAATFGVTAIATRLDVTDTASITDTADAAVAELGGLDIWVNNAGIYPSTPVLEMTDDDWERVLDVNLRGTFVGSREAARRMVEAGRGGVIVNLSSRAGVRGSGTGIPHYVASKFAIRGLTQQLALEFAEHGIRVLGGGAHEDPHARSRGRHCGADAVRERPRRARSGSRSGGWANPTTSPGSCCSARATCRCS